MRTAVILVAVLGSAQALFLAGALCMRPNNQRANRALAALLVTMALYLGGGAYQLSGLVIVWPLFFGWTHPIPLLFGPLLFLYARFVMDSNRRVRLSDGWHALPALVVVAWSLPIYLLPAAEKAALFKTVAGGVTPPEVARNLQVAVWLKIVSGLVYTALTARLVVIHRRVIREHYSTLDRISLDWLLTLLTASAVVWTIALAARILEPWEIVRPGTGDVLITLLMVVATYAIGYRGLQQSSLGELRAASPTAASPAEEVVDEAASVIGEAPGRPLLPPGMATAIEHRLRLVMERDEPWRNPELTLSDLAARLSTTTHKLSAVLNSRVEQSFYDFVNGYRVRDVQRQLMSPSAESRTVLAMSMDAGFASKSTFNAVFRRQVGMTPSSWRKAQRVNPASLEDLSVRMDPAIRLPR